MIHPMNRPALVTQAQVARVLRAAKAAGARAVEVQPSGAILIRLDGEEVKVPPQSTAQQVDKPKDFRL